MLHRIAVCARAHLADKLEYAYRTAIKNIEDGEYYLEYIKSNLELSSVQKNIQHTFYLFGMVSYLESFFADVLNANLISFPNKIEDKGLKLETVGKYGSALGIIKYAAEKYSNELNYKPFKELIAILSDAYSIKSALNEDLIECVNEVKCTRDIYSHNGGIINEIYERKAGMKARRPDNKKLPLTDIYIKESTTKIRELIISFYESASSFKRYDKVYAFEEMWKYTKLNRVLEFNTIWEIADDSLSKGERLVRPKEFGKSWAWSSSEQVLYDFFEHIYSSAKIDFIYLIKRWPAETAEGQVILSWLDSPFYF